MELVWNADEAIVPSHTESHSAEEAAVDDRDAAYPLVAKAVQGDRRIWEHEIAPNLIGLLNQVRGQLQESRPHIPDTGHTLFDLDDRPSLGRIYATIIGSQSRLRRHELMLPLSY
jgi:hypothetical protein